MAKYDKRHAQDIATRFQVYLERLKTQEVRDFSAVFAKIDKATRELIGALDEPNIGKLSKRRLAELLSEYKKINTDLIDKAVGQLGSNLQSIAGYSAAFEVRAILSLAKAKLATPSYAEAYKAALDQPMSATGAKLPEFLGDWSTAEVKRLNNSVQRAWGEGWTNQELVQSIRGTKALNFKDGILATSKRNAESVGRTAIQHVANTGRMSVWEKNKDVVEKYKWVSTLDSATTQICRSLDGQEFPVGQGPVPPAHMGCRSTTVAVVSEDLGLDFLDEGATRSSANGYVDADLTYYDWLKQQPKAFQDEAIGPVRGQLMRDGGLSSTEFATLNLNRNFQPLTLAEMQKLEPQAFERAGKPKLNDS